MPGIDFTNDPLLQGRLFSYLDTQLLRLGGPNFAEIPVNRPVAPVHTNQRDAFHRMTTNKGKVSYAPNSIDNGYPKTASKEEHGYVHYAEKVEGKKVRVLSESFKDFFSQTTLFWNSMSEPEKMYIVKALYFKLGKVMSKEIRQRMVDLLNNIDDGLAVEVAQGIGIPGPGGKAKEAMVADGGGGKTKVSPALSMENTVKNTIKSRMVAILAADGFNHSELMQVKTALEEAGAHPKIVSKFLGTIKSADGQEVMVDKNHVATGSIMYDAIFVPGRKGSVETLKMQGDAIHFINEAFKHCKAIGATSEGADLLLASDIKGVQVARVESQDEIVDDTGVVMVRKPSSTCRFNEEFKLAIAQHRHWEREKKEQVPA